jgi:dihydropyrimidinase
MQEVAALDGIALIHAENDEIIEELLRQNARAGRTARQHNASARPPAMEGEAVYRALAMAEVAGARALIFHLTAAEAVREVRHARSRGQIAHGEACLTYLLLDPSALDDPVSGTALDFSPPLRPVAHRDALWAGLADGTIDIVSTDHGPRRRVRGEDGALSTPPGTAGIEVRLALVYTHGVREGRLSLHQWVDRCCTRPAELFGLERKGRLAPGYDADIVIFDPGRDVALGRETLHSDIDHSTYEGFTARGFPTTTISRGRVLVHDGELLTGPADGHGRFIERGPGRPAPAPARPLAVWS